MPHPASRQTYVGPNIISLGSRIPPRFYAPSRIPPNLCWTQYNISRIPHPASILCPIPHPAKPMLDPPWRFWHHNKCHQLTSGFIARVIPSRIPGVHIRVVNRQGSAKVQNLLGEERSVGGTNYYLHCRLCCNRKFARLRSCLLDGKWWKWFKPEGHSSNLFTALSQGKDHWGPNHTTKVPNSEQTAGQLLCCSVVPFGRE